MKIEENQSKIYWSQGNHESVFFLIIEPVYHETNLKKKITWDMRGGERSSGKSYVVLLDRKVFGTIYGRPLNMCLNT